MPDSIMFHDGNRLLQDAFDSRRISDRLEEKLTRTTFSDDDKAWILEEAGRPGASAADIARRYGIAERVLRRWKQELATAPVFVAVQITDPSVQPTATPADERSAP